tara:strand:- start:186 stop:656 length:471 start_codon:yes stop_codon:yes gene_type:complete
MSFGYSILGFGAYPSRGVADVSNVLIEDDSGNDNRFTKVENSGGSNVTTHDNDFAAPIVLVAGVSGGYTMTLNLNSSFTGGAAAIAWTITEVDDPNSIVSISTNTASSTDFDAVFTISAGAARGVPPANYTFALAVTGINTNVITTTYTNVIMLVP